MVAELHAVPSGADEAPEAPEPQIIRLSTTRKAGKEKRVPLFYVDDTLYTIPTTAPPALALRYMHTARIQGEQAAIDVALNGLLGAEAYAALMTCEDLTVDGLKAIIQRVVDVMQGPLEGPKGTSQPA